MVTPVINEVAIPPPHTHTASLEQKGSVTFSNEQEREGRGERTGQSKVYQSKRAQVKNKLPAYSHVIIMCMYPMSVYTEVGLADEEL